jgi:hypothetical protein
MSKKGEWSASEAGKYHQWERRKDTTNTMAILQQSSIFENDCTLENFAFVAFG